MSPVWSISGDTLFYYEGPVLIAAALSLGDQAVVQSRGPAYLFPPSFETPGVPPQYDVNASMAVFVGGSSTGNSIVVRTSFLPSGP